MELSTYYYQVLKAICRNNLNICFSPPTLTWKEIQALNDSRSSFPLQLSKRRQFSEERGLTAKLYELDILPLNAAEPLVPF